MQFYFGEHFFNEKNQSQHRTKIHSYFHKKSGNDDEVFEALVKNVHKNIVKKHDLLTYLCGTTTNIWLRPDQEDLSMTACLEHSASNL
jgi:hypothetical protein